MLLYGERIGSARARASMPPGDGTPEDDFPRGSRRRSRATSAGSSLFSLIMGASAGVALWIFGAVGIFPDGQTLRRSFFGAFFGLMELIPYVGPVLGALPPILVALFQDPIDRRLGGAALPRASSSSRATSWRRRSSARRCASTRCS